MTSKLQGFLLHFSKNQCFLIWATRLRKGIGIPIYGPLQIGKTEPINLQFGRFGITTRPSEGYGTNHARNVDESNVRELILVVDNVIAQNPL